MENETLTTAPNEEHVEETPIEEQSEQTEQHVEEPTTDASYDDAWDKLDLEDSASVDSLLSEGDAKPVEESNEKPEETEEEKAAIAFMEAAPVLKFKGKDVPIDSPDEIIALAQKGFLLETEQAKIKPMKKIVNTVSGVPIEVLQAVADLNEGKQEALDFLKEHYGIKQESDDNPFGYDEEEPKKETAYKPNVEPDDPVKEIFDSVVEEAPEVAAKVTETFKGIDPAFQNELYSPEVFPAFVKSVELGEFEEVYPVAVKEKMLNPALNWLQAYQSAAGKVGNQQSQSEPPVSAQPPREVPQRSLDTKVSADDIWADDEAFERMQREIFQS